MFFSGQLFVLLPVNYLTNKRFKRKVFAKEPVVNLLSLQLFSEIRHFFGLQFLSMPVIRNSLCEQSDYAKSVSKRIERRSPIHKIWLTFFHNNVSLFTTTRKKEESC